MLRTTTEIARNIYDECCRDIQHPINPTPLTPLPSVGSRTSLDISRTSIQARESRESDLRGSITPTTEGSPISILYTPASLNELSTRLQQHLITLYQDQLNNPRSTIKDEMINKFYHVLQDSKNINSPVFIFERQYQVYINLTPTARAAVFPPITGSPAPEGPLVKRFGIYSEAVLPALQNNYYLIPLCQLHFVEKEAFRWALEELNSKLSAETFTSSVPLSAAASPTNPSYPLNVVVVDIFVRPGNKMQLEDTTTFPAIHSIVLWKKTDKLIVLIDPNRQQFSKHICKSLRLLFRTAHPSFDFRVSNLPKERMLYASKNDKNPQSTGYSKYSLPMPKPRDCTDIAVKIAFEINEQQYDICTSSSSSSRIGIDDIEGNVYRQISNQFAIASHIPLQINSTFIRELQGSRRQDRIAAKMFLETPGMDTAIKNMDKNNRWKSLEFIQSIILPPPPSSGHISSAAVPAGPLPPAQ